MRLSACWTSGSIELVKNWVNHNQEDEQFEVIFENFENFESFENFAGSGRFAGSKTFVSTLAETMRQVSQAACFSKLNKRFSSLRCRFDHGS